MDVGPAGRAEVGAVPQLVVELPQREGHVPDPEGRYVQAVDDGLRDVVARAPDLYGGQRGLGCRAGFRLRARLRLDGALRGQDQLGAGNVQADGPAELASLGDGLPREATCGVEGLGFRI